MKRLIKSALNRCGIDIRRVRQAHAAAEDILPTPDLHSIPSVSFDDILGSRKPDIYISVQKYEDGILPTDQMVILLSLLVAEHPEAVLEIGTFMGHTTKAMARNLPSAVIHTVDLPPNFNPTCDRVSHLVKDDYHLIAKRNLGREFIGTEYERRIRQHLADTALWDFRNAPGATFFFIDGAHTYDYCKNDSEKCLDLCCGEGVFLWHDCDDGHPGVIKLIHEWREMGRDIVRVNNTALAYWKSHQSEEQAGERTT